MRHGWRNNKRRPNFQDIIGAPSQQGGNLDEKNDASNRTNI
jgi:hypothetical protein